MTNDDILSLGWEEITPKDEFTLPNYLHIYEKLSETYKNERFLLKVRMVRYLNDIFVIKIPGTFYSAADGFRESSLFEGKLNSKEELEFIMKSVLKYSNEKV